MAPGCLCEAHIQILPLFPFAIWKKDLTSVLTLIASWPFHHGVCYAFQCPGFWVFLEEKGHFDAKHEPCYPTTVMAGVMYSRNNRGFQNHKQAGLFCYSCWVLLTCRSSEAGPCPSHSVLGLTDLLLQVPEWYSGSHESSGDGSAPSVSEGGDSVSAWWVSKHIKDLIAERIPFGPRRSVWTPFEKDCSNFMGRLRHTGFLLKVCQSDAGFCRGV